MGKPVPRGAAAAPPKTHVLTAPDGRPVTPPRPRRPPRKRQFDADPDATTCAAVVRGSLIAAFDAAFCSGRLGLVLWQGEGEPAALREKGLEVFQEMMAAVFPEDFAEPAEAAARPGVCPPAGPRRVGTDRLRRFVGADAGLLKLAGKMKGR